MNPKILVVDDDRPSVETTIEVLEREGYQLFSASGGRQALEVLREEDINVVITDLKMPDLSGIDLLKYIQNCNLHTQVIILTGYGTTDSAVEAMREGAFNYLQKPIDINILRQTVINALEKQLLLRQNIILREQLDDKFGFDNIIGKSKQMLELFRKIRLVAPTKATVLITGESGVGKELIAKAIHNHSPRKDSSYKPINCGVLHRELLESELFGHERGAFTGATANKRGVFEQADGGTLFLDEVGEMGPETQVKFLRVLEEHEFTRLGGDRTLHVDVRVIAATNKDLESAVQDHTFRADLYYRINRFPMPVPPLRERHEDIPLLVTAFIREFSKEHNKSLTHVTPEAMEYLKNADWPGNVRELRNVLETAVILATSHTIELKDLDSEFQNEIPFPALTSDDAFAKVGMTMDDIEKEAIAKTLTETCGNKKRAAEMLGIGLRTLYRKLESYGWLNKGDGDANDSGL